MNQHMCIDCNTRMNTCVQICSNKCKPLQIKTSHTTCVCKCSTRINTCVCRCNAAHESTKMQHTNQHMQVQTRINTCRRRTRTRINRRINTCVRRCRTRIARMLTQVQVATAPHGEKLLRNIELVPKSRAPLCGSQELEPTSWPERHHASCVQAAAAAKATYSACRPCQDP